MWHTLPEAVDEAEAEEVPEAIRTGGMLALALTLASTPATADGEGADDADEETLGSDETGAASLATAEGTTEDTDAASLAIAEGTTEGATDGAESTSLATAEGTTEGKGAASLAIADG